MSLDAYTRIESRLGGMSLLSSSTRGCYGQHAGAPFLEGTRQGIFFTQLSLRSLGPNGITTGTLTNSWTFSLTAANNETNSLNVRAFSSGQQVHLWLRKTGEPNQTYINDPADAPASMRIPHFRWGGYIPFLILFDGSSITLCQLSVNRYGESAAYVHKTQHTCPWTFNWNDFQSSSGYCMINRTFPGQSGTPVICQANTMLASLKDGIAFEDLFLDRDETIAELMSDPATFISRTPGAWSKILSPQVVDSTGAPIRHGRLITAGSDKLVCPNTGTEWSLNGVGTGSIYARERFSVPTERPTQSQANGSGPIAIEHDGIVLAGESWTDNSNAGMSYLTRRRVTTGELIAPPVYIPSVQFFTDASNGSAITRVNGDVFTRPLESHEAFPLVIDPNGSQIGIGKCWHHSTVSNFPETSDVTIDTGCFGVFDGSRVAAYEPPPLKSFTGGARGVSYLRGLVHEGTFHWYTRRGDTNGGMFTLAEQTAGGHLTTREITRAASAETHVLAAFPTDFLKVTPTLALAIGAQRQKPVSPVRYTGSVGVLLDLETRKVYLPRTGEDVTASIGSVQGTNSGFFFVPGLVQDAMVAGTFDGDTEYERRMGTAFGNGWSAHQDGDDYYVGGLINLGDPTLTQVYLAVFKVEGFQLTHVRNIDLTALCSEMAGEESVETPGVEEWQWQANWGIYNDGGDFIFAIPHGNGLDFSGQVTDDGRRVGTHLSLGVVENWWHESPTLTAVPNAVVASDYGFGALRPYKIHNSLSMGVGMITDGATQTTTAALPESFAVYHDLRPYLSASTLVPTPSPSIDIPTAAELSEPGVMAAYLEDRISAGWDVPLPGGEINANIYIDQDSVLLRGTSYQLRGRSFGTRIRPANPALPTIQIRNADCVTLENLGVLQTDPSPSAFAGVGVSIEGSDGSLTFHTTLSKVAFMNYATGVQVSEPVGTRVGQNAAADVVIDRCIFTNCTNGVVSNHAQSVNVHITNQTYFYSVANAALINNGGRFLINNCCANPVVTILKILGGGRNLQPSIIRNFYSDRTGGAPAPIVVDARGCSGSIKVLIDAYSMSYNADVSGPFEDFVHTHFYLPDGNDFAANTSIIRVADRDFFNAPGTIVPYNTRNPSQPPLTDQIRLDELLAGQTIGQVDSTKLSFPSDGVLRISNSDGSSFIDIAPE